MKRISVLFLFLLLLASCSFSDEAERRLSAYMKSIVADPEQSIEDKSFLWSDDSLCIIEFNLRARNENGGYEITKYQYFYVIGDTARYEGALRIPYNTTFQECLKGEKSEKEIRKNYYEHALYWGRMWDHQVKD